MATNRQFLELCLWQWHLYFDARHWLMENKTLEPDVDLADPATVLVFTSHQQLPFSLAVNLPTTFLGKNTSRASQTQAASLRYAYCRCPLSL